MGLPVFAFVNSAAYVLCSTCSLAICYCEVSPSPYHEWFKKTAVYVHLCLKSRPGSGCFLCLPRLVTQLRSSRGWLGLRQPETASLHSDSKVDMGVGPGFLTLQLDAMEQAVGHKAFQIFACSHTKLLLPNYIYQSKC